MDYNEREAQRRQEDRVTPSLDLQKREQDLRRKKERYQEMYAAEVLTMEELKGKTEVISKELQSLEEERVRSQRRQEAQRDGAETARRDREELQRFLALETLTNVELRTLVDSIRVHPDGTVQILLKPLNVEEGGESLPI